MRETTIEKLKVSVGLEVDCKTAYTCLGLLEAYLDDNENETLHIYCDECGNWDLGFVNRELVKSRLGEQNE